MPHTMPHLDQLTLRGLDPRVQREIRAIARREGVSLNKAALRLLERGVAAPSDAAGLAEGLAPQGSPDRIGHALDHLIGTWSSDEAESFLASLGACAQIDDELWT